MYSAGSWAHYSPWFAGSGSVSSQPQHEGENKKPEAQGTWSKEKNADGKRDSRMALSTPFLTPSRPRVCPEDGWGEVRLVEGAAAVAIWVPFSCRSITEARLSSSCCGYRGKVRARLLLLPSQMLLFQAVASPIALAHHQSRVTCLRGEEGGELPWWELRKLRHEPPYGMH